MSVKPPRRWTPRSLMAIFLPHLFRKARNRAESITGPFNELVPLDAHESHMYIKSKEKKMVKGIRASYMLNTERPKTLTRTSIWSITTGEWVYLHSLKLHYVFPFSLGPTVSRDVSSRISFQGPNNGMLVPPAVGNAFNDWSLVIAPHEDHHGTVVPTSFLFRTLESGTKSLQEPVSKTSDLSVRDLDRKPLHLKNRMVPCLDACYFHSCCAVWKSTFLEDPERRAEEFWERFQSNMHGLWGSPRAQKRILNIFKPPELVLPEKVGLEGARLENMLSSKEKDAMFRLNNPKPFRRLDL